MTTNEPRCIHRHTIKTHPACFAKGRVVQVEDEDMKKRIRTEAFPVGPYKRVNVAKEPWYQVEGTKVGYCDIETSSFKANVGFMVSWAVKEKGGKVVYDEVTQKEVIGKQFDLRIVKSLLEELRKYNVIVTYYGTRFDIPFIRTRAEYWYNRLREEKRVKLANSNVKTLHKTLEKQLSDTKRVPSRLVKEELIDLLLDRDDELNDLLFPELGTIYHWDLYYTVRNRFCLHRNSLGAVTEFFGIEGKTHLKPWEWELARIADPDIMPVIEEHNIEDVIILERIHDIVNPYKKWTRRPL